MSLLSFLFLPLVGWSVLAEQPAVEKLDEAGLKKLTAERQGKVLLLNIWATWCTPCSEEFPDIVKLAEEYRGQRVEFVGLSVDYPDEISTKIIPFLTRTHAHFKNYVADFTNDETLISLVHEKWNGGIPATAIYGAGGTQEIFLVGRQSYAELKSKIEVVLREAR